MTFQNFQGLEIQGIKSCNLLRQCRWCTTLSWLQIRTQTDLSIITLLALSRKRVKLLANFDAVVQQLFRRLQHRHTDQRPLSTCSHVSQLPVKTDQRKLPAFHQVQNGFFLIISSGKHHASVYPICYNSGCALYAAVAVSRVWNSLPHHVTSAQSLPVFCSRL